MALENYIQSSHMSEADKLRARREWSVKETALLRRRRVKLKVSIGPVTRVILTALSKRPRTLTT